MYKVGDIVKVIDKVDLLYNKIGTVYKTDDSEVSICVKFSISERKHPVWFREHELKKNTTKEAFLFKMIKLYDPYISTNNGKDTY